MKVLLILSLYQFGVTVVDGRHNSQVLPRSSRDVCFSSQPWSPSSQIDDQGFLSQVYTRIPGIWEKEQPLPGRYRRLLDEENAHVRQVPGDGNCLFNAIIVSLCKVEQGKHYPFDRTDFRQLRQYAQALRENAVDYMEKRTNSHHVRPLYLQGDNYMDTRELLQQFASQYGLSIQEYCDTMRQDGVWAGGPEIVALCNMLKRPIHLYELHVRDEDSDNRGNNDGRSNVLQKRSRFCLRRMCCFGSPRFDNQEAIHVLSADSRFPDILPGRQIREGNHFLSVFPVEQSSLAHRPQRVRGGGSGSVRVIQSSLE